MIPRLEIMRTSTFVIRNDKAFIITVENEIEVDGMDILSVSGNVRTLKAEICGSHYLYQNKIFDTLYSSQDLVEFNNHGTGFSIIENTFVEENLLLGNKETRTYWLFNNETGVLTDLGYIPKHHLIYNNRYFEALGVQVIKAFDFENNLLWETDITRYGNYITLTGEKKLNEREYPILSCSGNVLVPLKGGQLLALDGETGVEEWIWSDGDRGGKYGSDEEYVYNTDGLHLRKIEGTKGELLCKKTLRDDSINQDFYSGGPVWVRGDYIILADPTLGRIALYNKEDLSLFKYFEIDSRIPNSESPIQVEDNLLFILGMDHILRIYDLNEWI